MASPKETPANGRQQWSGRLVDTYQAHSRNCGMMFRQLIQPYVQNSTKTTRSFKSAMASGLLLIQFSPPTSGATLLTVMAVPCFGHNVQTARASPIKAQKAANRNTSQRRS